MQIHSASSIFTTLSNLVSTAYFTTLPFICFQIIYHELISFYAGGKSVQKHPEDMYTQFQNIMAIQLFSGSIAVA